MTAVGTANGAAVADGLGAEGSVAAAATVVPGPVGAPLSAAATEPATVGSIATVVVGEVVVGGNVVGGNVVGGVVAGTVVGSVVNDAAFVAAAQVCSTTEQASF